jgi:hypothetical protein
MEALVTPYRLSTRRGVRIAAVPLVAAAGLMFGAQPATADLVDPPGSCLAVATWTGAGVSVDSSTANPDTVVEIPRSDSVEWSTHLVGPQDGTERQISGSLTLALPVPLGAVTIDDWSGSSTTVADSGTRAYDLPALVPAGVVFKLQGEHHENGTLFCSGSASLRIAGGPFDSPLTWISLVMTALLGVGLLVAGRSPSPGVGRMILGALLGLLLGWLLGLTLVLFGVSTLDGPLPLILAILGLAGGPVWVRLSPFRRTGTPVT